jgi:hypothetical protein
MPIVKGTQIPAFHNFHGMKVAFDDIHGETPDISAISGQFDRELEHSSYQHFYPKRGMRASKFRQMMPERHSWRARLDKSRSEPGKMHDYKKADPHSRHRKFTKKTQMPATK